MRWTTWSMGCWLCAAAAVALADGTVVGPATYKGVPYKGSPQESAQEAIILFQEGSADRVATEDLILRVTVEGDVDQFAWVIPFPRPPKITKEDGKLFGELYAYVEARKAQLYSRGKKGKSDGLATRPAAEPKAVEVISRKVVGSYDTAVVRENAAGALNGWLKKEGFQALDNAEDVLGFYRKKKYVYACVKVSEATLVKGTGVDLHPLRFTFETGGRDAIYFPMKLTGLQAAPFDVNLYVFYRAWLNDHLNRYGYEHRGFRLRYRDWDSPSCKANAGKTWSAPARDPFLRDQAARLPTVTRLFQKLHPGKRFYLTNVEARGLKPGDVREWADDLWLFPYYTNRDFVPYDARQARAASGTWPDAPTDEQVAAQVRRGARPMGGAALIAGCAVIVLAAVVLARRRSRAAGPGASDSA